jgi:hypothetical protein
VSVNPGSRISIRIPILKFRTECARLSQYSPDEYVAQPLKTSEVFSENSGPAPLAHARGSESATARRPVLP